MADENHIENEHPELPPFITMEQYTNGRRHRTQLTELTDGLLCTLRLRTGNDDSAYFAVDLFVIVDTVVSACDDSGVTSYLVDFLTEPMPESTDTGARLQVRFDAKGIAYHDIDSTGAFQEWGYVVGKDNDTQPKPLTGTYDWDAALRAEVARLALV